MRTHSLKLQLYPTLRKEIHPNLISCRRPGCRKSKKFANCGRRPPPPWGFLGRTGTERERVLVAHARGTQGNCVIQKRQIYLKLLIKG